MAWIRHDSGERRTIKNQQALGPESPLETDEDGYAEVSSDEVARLLSAIDSHIEVASAPDSEEDEDTVGMESPAEALARDHWQSTVKAIEEGEADEYLDELAELDDRASVQEAIEERRE